MDPVDVLTMAVDAARMIRSAADPDATLAEACRLVGCRPAAPAEPVSLVVARLVEAAGENRAALGDFLRGRRGPLYMNRHDKGWGRVVGDGGDYEPDPEVAELVEYVESEAARGRRIDLAGERMGAFAVGPRAVVHYISGETLDGQPVELPPAVRGLIDYPLDKPVLFTIETGQEPWSLWDVWTAFADQYGRIYEQPDRYGVWGHDMDDLWIERMFYYPDRRLVYPYVGS
jgi:hypothetical protein